jgi:hypothetical protein
MFTTGAWSPALGVPAESGSPCVGAYTERNQGRCSSS